MPNPTIINRVTNFIRKKFYAEGTPLAGSTPRERYENMSINPDVRSRISGRSREETGQMLKTAFASTLPGAGITRAGTRGAGLFSKAYQGGKNILSKINVFDKLNVGQKLLKVGKWAGASELAYYSATGEFSPINSRRIAGFLSVGTSVRGAVVGGLAGASSNLMSLYNKNMSYLPKGYTPQIPNIPSPTINISSPSVGFPTQSSLFPTEGFNFTSPSSSNVVSVSAGGGGGDFGLMQYLLLGLGVGGLGYALGRRKKRKSKKKKYKRGRKR